jgi:hypothetical protein
LYLNDINIRLNQKIAADLSESSDNECHVMSSDEF